LCDCARTDEDERVVPVDCFEMKCFAPSMDGIPCGGTFVTPKWVESPGVKKALQAEFKKGLDGRPKKYLLYGRESKNMVITGDRLMRNMCQKESTTNLRIRVVVS